MEAASAGHVDIARQLLEAGAGINTHSNEFKESALTLACYKGECDSKLCQLIKYFWGGGGGEGDLFIYLSLYI